jgi:hypothetical protein
MDIIERLSEYLDRSQLQKPELIEGQFRKAAEFLLRNCLIRRDENDYQINEVEFYYYSGNHPDPFTHRHPEQLKMGSWYFHETGQDITFGDGKNYGGILIRGIRDAVTGMDADGPVKTCERLFNAGGPGIRERHSMDLIPSGKPLVDDHFPLYAFPRVGLQPTGDKPGDQFILAPYRCMFFPEITSRDRNVIFFFLKYIYALERIPQAITADSATIRLYEKLYQHGRDMDPEEYRRIISGELKMNVTNKSRLLGYCYKGKLKD